MVSLLFLGLSSFSLALVLTPLFCALFRRFGCFDQPDHDRKLHDRPVPRIGGLAIIIAYAASFALLMACPLAGAEIVTRSLPLAWKLIPAALVVFATGLLDDCAGLSPLQKLGGQIVAAGLACSAGVSITAIGSIALPGWAGAVLTVFWLTACANAFNLIDGVDGLAAGLGLLATLTTLTGALLLGHTGLAFATVPLAGALLAFLRYNFNPASVFLGDCGSLTVGFLLGCYAIVWSHKTATLLGMTAPLVALAIPLADTALAIVRRLLRGQPVFAGDRSHIHHKLLERGLTPRRVALVLYSIGGLAAVVSLVQSVATQRLGAAVLIAACVAAWFGIQYLGYAELGIARRMMAPAAFLRIVNAQIRLRALEDKLVRARNTGECWDAIGGACREFGFSRIVMRLGPATRDEWLRAPSNPAACWILRVPLSADDYVNLGHEFGSLIDSMVLASFAGVLRKTLTPKLYVLRGEELAPEPVPVVIAEPIHAPAVEAEPAPAALTPA